MKKLFFIIISISISSISFTQIINIPNDYSTIQEGIDIATNGDTVLVDTGIYFENINFNGKKITVGSKYLFQKDSIFIYNTIINGSMPSNPDFGSVVSLISGEDSTSCIYGFTITGGSGFYVQGDTPYRVGGGIVTNSGCKIESNIITDNHCIMNEPDGFASGGGISAGPAGNENLIIIKTNLIYNNSVWANGTATSWDLALGQGGGIYLAYSGKIAGNVINSNWCKSTHSYSAGGGIRLQTMIGNTALVHINKNRIYNNESISVNANGFGGGICCSIINSIIENNYIANNKVDALNSKGGALYFDLSGGAFSSVINNYFISNHCLGNSSYGGAIGIYAAQNIQLIGNLIIENSSINGGGIYLKESHSNIVNNTFSQNIAQNAGGALYIFDISSGAYITSTIMWNDSANGIADEVSASNPDIIEIVYSNIANYWSGEGNIIEDPLFVGSGTDPYQINDYSPCIDAGNPDTTGLYLTEYDLAGEDRIFNNRVDMGAFEWNTFVGIDDFIARFNEIEVFNSPNPFTTSTTLSYELKQPSSAQLSVFNQLGQMVYQHSENQQQGEQQLQWDAQGQAEGLYYYRLQIGDQVANGKMVKVR